MISVIVGLLCSLLLLLAYNNLFFQKSLEAEERVSRNIRSAIDLVLADTSIVLEEQVLSKDLFESAGDSVCIKKENWGIFSIASVVASYKGKRKIKNFFFGAGIISPLDGCLYIADHKTPLLLVGNTRLTGDAFLPPAGIRPGYIDQRGFDHEKLINGKVRDADDSLPFIDQRLIARLTNVPRGPIESYLSDTMDRSFSDTPRTIYMKNQTLLSACRISGHILILSDSAVRISADAKLENVIVSAPVIEVDPGFSGAVQLQASDSIILHNDCHLRYPSALILFKKSGASFQPKIRIGENCDLTGVVLSHCPGPDRNDLIKTYVELGRNSVVTGYIYASGSLELKGSVHGTVLADQFISKFNFSILVNYLVDVEIDRSALPSSFTGPHIFTNPGQNKVIQWVN
jgi:hypothetical protein